MDFLLLPRLAWIASPDGVILGTFAVAVVIFVVAWALRGGARREEDPEGVAAVPLDSPYAAPMSAPPPLPPAARVVDAPGRMKVSTRPYRGLDLPLIGLLVLIYAAMTLGAGSQAETPVEQKLTAPVLVASIVMQFMFMGMVLAFVSWRVQVTEWLGLRWKQWPQAFAIAPVALFFMWFLMAILAGTGWNQWLEESLGIESMQDAVKLLQEAKDPAVLALMAVAAVFVAPLAEEVIFRGYLYPAAKRFCGPWAAVVFSSLVFAAAHGNVVALVPLFILAVVLCLVYEFTGSIWSCIAIHFLFNAATVTIQLLIRAGYVEMPAAS